MLSMQSIRFLDIAVKHYLILFMLKFLNGREDDRSPKRSPIKYLPEMCYGNSYESPQEFQTGSTIFHNKTYLNPFLKFEKPRYDKFPPQIIAGVEPKWTRKRNLSMIEEHKILKDSQQEDYPQHKSKYLDSFHQQFQENPNRFRITRGQFTSFIQKNNHYKSIGPLQGIERTMHRIQDRRKSVWVKSPSNKQQMTASLRYASSLNTTVKCSIGENAELITEKYRIRKNREKLQRIFKRQLQNRKKNINIGQFTLSKEGTEAQFYLPTPNLTQRKTSEQSTLDLNHLQKFETQMYRRLK